MKIHSALLKLNSLVKIKDIGTLALLYTMNGSINKSSLFGGQFFSSQNVYFELTLPLLRISHTDLLNGCLQRCVVGGEVGGEYGLFMATLFVRTQIAGSILSVYQKKKKKLNYGTSNQWKYEAA